MTGVDHYTKKETHEMPRCRERYIACQKWREYRPKSPLRNLRFPEVVLMLQFQGHDSNAVSWKSFWEERLTTKNDQRYRHFFFNHVSVRLNTFQEDVLLCCTVLLLYRLDNLFLQGGTTRCNVIWEINFFLQLKFHVRLKRFSVFSFCFPQMATPIQRS